MKSKYNDLKKIFSDLPDAKTKEQISNALEEWERNNPSKCQLMNDEHQFFGYKEVGGGKIDKYVKFLLIPAVREASLDATESRGSILSELMDLTVRKILTEKEELKQLDRDTRDKYKKILEWW
ncbi:ATP-dependent endonuclease, OLD family protein [mine drainage metagenome]|uniref:ATP-dependent endonuclease, OLD family protein n=1 Tax=mine drainage metagenome TaxID=410659 RepID=T1APG6_9ZZZZ